MGAHWDCAVIGGVCQGKLCFPVGMTQVIKNCICGGAAWRLVGLRGCGCDWMRCGLKVRFVMSVDWCLMSCSVVNEHVAGRRVDWTG